MTGALNGTSATFSGDLTVDTNTLHVDSTNNRVGVGIDAPAGKLDVLVGGNERLILSTQGTDPLITAVNGNNSAYTSLQLNGSDIRLSSSGAERVRIKDNDVFLGPAAAGTTHRFFAGTGATAEQGLAGFTWSYDDRSSLGLQIRTDSLYASSYPITFGTTGSSDMTLDTSGNFLVGTTDPDAASLNVEGISLSAGSYGGYFAASRQPPTSTAPVARLNRKGSDGDILTLTRDGSSVGGIISRSGVVSGLILDPRNPTYEGVGLAGGSYDANNSILIPMDGSGVNSNGAMDLGTSTTNFRDIYLSGGVVFGSTGGSVTSKTLDDYEEGTFTPVVRDASSGGNTASSYLVATGRYTKVGRMVHATINFVNIDTTGMTSGNSVYITGLPFTAVNSFGYPTVPVNVSAVSSANGYVRGSVFYNASHLSLSEGTTTGGAALTVSDLTSGDADIYINFSYEAQ
jgi:hypothetical protein